jgi:hypothetical protein
VDAGFFDVLHDAADDNATPVTDRVDVQFRRIVEELVNQNRVFARDFDGLFDDLTQGRLVVDDIHRPAAQHERRTNQQRIAQLRRRS